MTAPSATSRSSLPRPQLIHIRLTAIGWTTAGAGALVVFFAIGFLVPLFGSLHQLARLALINGPLVVAYLGVSGVAVSRHFGRHVSTALAWVREDRPPNEREHEQTLRLASYAVKIDALAAGPTAVVRLLNRFFRVVIEVVEGEHGMVNKFEGDAALCVFGAPVSRENPTVDALPAARALAERLSAELPEVDFGIGISAGLAVAGHVGAEHRFEYTVIGDPVNEAARLAELAKRRPGRVLASDAALDRAPSHETEGWHVTEAAVLRGRSVPTGLGRPEPRAG